MPKKLVRRVTTIVEEFVESARNADGPTYYRCADCRGIDRDWYERCPDCGARGMMRPYDPDAELAEAESRAAGRFKTLGKVKAVKMPRLLTGIHGLDLVLGGDDEPGFAMPSFVLFGGSQGAGKSSLALQAAVGINPKYRLLCCLNEEPEARLRQRAERIGYREEAIDHIHVCESFEMADYEDAIAEVDPHFILLDSLSMMKDSRTDTNDEQKNRLRYAEWFFNDAMANKRVVLAISHLNKDDDIAGARKIQYTIDAVMTITKVGKNHSVLECPEKNRFGPPGVQQFFAIGKQGLHEVEKADALKAAMKEKASEKNPDEVF